MKASHKIGSVAFRLRLALDERMKILSENTVGIPDLALAMAKLKSKKNGRPGGAQPFTHFSSLLQGATQKSAAAKSVPMADIVSQVMGAADPLKRANAELSLNDFSSVKVQHHNHNSGDPMMALEGHLMGRFVDAMLPKGKDSTYGAGLAGDTWRSFAVDQMASSLAKSDPLKLTVKPFASNEIDQANLDVPSLYGAASAEEASPAHITPFVSKV